MESSARECCGAFPLCLVVKKENKLGILPTSRCEPAFAYCITLCKRDGGRAQREKDEREKRSRRKTSHTDKKLHTRTHFLLGHKGLLTSSSIDQNAPLTTHGDLIAGQNGGKMRMPMDSLGVFFSTTVPSEITAGFRTLFAIMVVLPTRFQKPSQAYKS